MGLIQKPYVGIGLNKNHQLAQGLVGCWVMNEATGDKVFDLSGNGNHSINNGADWVNGRLHFVSSNSDYVLSSANVNHNIGSGDFTYSAWIKLDTYAGTPTGESIIANGNYAPVFIIHDSDHKLGLYWSGVRNFDTPVLAINTLYHVAAVRRGTTVTVYVNAIPGASTVEINYTMSNAKCTVGRSGATSSGDYTNGYLNLPMIYNRALSPEEIAYLHREPYAMFQPEFPIWQLYEEAIEANPYWYYDMLKRRNA